MTDPTTELARIEAYCDIAPRATADAEQVGPFTLFVARTGWPFYARPRRHLGHDGFAVAEVTTVVDRQRTLGVPLTLEWVHETAPGLAGAATDAGLVVTARPLMVLRGEPRRAVTDADVRMLDPEDADLLQARAAVSSGFRESDDLRPERVAATIQQRAREGLLRICGAFDPDGRAVGGGTNAPRADACELTGIAVLPSCRRRGIGAAITAVLADDARAHGADLVWLSATDDEVARVYAEAGFTRIGTSYEAEAPAR